MSFLLPLGGMRFSKETKPQRKAVEVNLKEDGSDIETRMKTLPSLSHTCQCRGLSSVVPKDMLRWSPAVPQNLTLFGNNVEDAVSEDEVLLE